MLGSDVWRACAERLFIGLHHAQLVREPLRVGEQDALALARDLDAMRAQVLGPEVERCGRAQTPRDAVQHARARAAARGAGILEERQVGTGRPLLVAVEEVVDGRVVLVDALLYQPQAEHAGVELDVGRCVAGDGGDVVDALELHRGARARLRDAPFPLPGALMPRIAASTSRRRSTSPRKPPAPPLKREEPARPPNAQP